MQYAYLTGVRDFVLNKKDYLMSQVGKISTFTAGQQC
jgi:hypothetical protein